MDTHETKYSNKPKKQELILEARHSRSIEAAKKLRSKLKSRIFMPRTPPEIYKYSSTIPRNQPKFYPNCLNSNEFKIDQHKFVKYIGEVPKSSISDEENINTKSFNIKNDFKTKSKQNLLKHKWQSNRIDTKTIKKTRKKLQNIYQQNFGQFNCHKMDATQKSENNSNIDIAPKKLEIMEDLLISLGLDKPAQCLKVMKIKKVITKPSTENSEIAINNANDLINNDNIEKTLKTMGLEVTDDHTNSEVIDLTSQPDIEQNSENNRLENCIYLTSQHEVIQNSENTLENSMDTSCHYVDNAQNLLNTSMDTQETEENCVNLISQQEVMLNSENAAEDLLNSKEYIAKFYANTIDNLLNISKETQNTQENLIDLMSQHEVIQNSENAAENLLNSSEHIAKFYANTIDNLLNISGDGKETANSIDLTDQHDIIQNSMDTIENNSEDVKSNSADTTRYSEDIATNSLDTTDNVLNTSMDISQTAENCIDLTNQNDVLEHFENTTSTDIQEEVEENCIDLTSEPDVIQNSDNTADKILNNSVESSTNLTTHPDNLEYGPNSVEIILKNNEIHIKPINHDSFEITESSAKTKKDNLQILMETSEDIIRHNRKRLKKQKKINKSKENIKKAEEIVKSKKSVKNFNSLTKILKSENISTSSTNISNSQKTINSSPKKKYLKSISKQQNPPPAIMRDNEIVTNYNNLIYPCAKDFKDIVEQTLAELNQYCASTPVDIEISNDLNLVESSINDFETFLQHTYKEMDLREEIHKHDLEYFSKKHSSRLNDLQIRPVEPISDESLGITRITDLDQITPAPLVLMANSKNLQPTSEEFCVQINVAEIPIQTTKFKASDVDETPNATKTKEIYQSTKLNVQSHKKIKLTGCEKIKKTSTQQTSVETISENTELNERTCELLTTSREKYQTSLKSLNQVNLSSNQQTSKQQNSLARNSQVQEITCDLITANNETESEIVSNVAHTSQDTEWQLQRQMQLKATATSYELNSQTLEKVLTPQSRELNAQSQMEIKRKRSGSCKDAIDSVSPNQATSSQQNSQPPKVFETFHSHEVDQLQKQGPLILKIRLKSGNKNSSQKDSKNSNSPTLNQQKHTTQTSKEILKTKDVLETDKNLAIATENETMENHQNLQTTPKNIVQNESPIHPMPQKANSLLVDQSQLSHNQTATRDQFRNSQNPPNLSTSDQTFNNFSIANLEQQHQSSKTTPEQEALSHNFNAETTKAFCDKNPEFIQAVHKHSSFVPALASPREQNYSPNQAQHNNNVMLRQLLRTNPVLISNSEQQQRLTSSTTPNVLEQQLFQHHAKNSVHPQALEQQLHRAYENSHSQALQQQLHSSTKPPLNPVYRQDPTLELRSTLNHPNPGNSFTSPLDRQQQNPANISSHSQVREQKPHPVNNCSSLHIREQHRVSNSTHPNSRTLEQQHSLDNFTHVQGTKQVQQHPANSSIHTQAREQQYPSNNYTYSQAREIHRTNKRKSKQNPDPELRSHEHQNPALLNSTHDQAISPPQQHPANNSSNLQGRTQQHCAGNYTHLQEYEQQHRENNSMHPPPKPICKKNRTPVIRYAQQHRNPDGQSQQYSVNNTLLSHTQNQQQFRSVQEPQNPAEQSQQHPVNKTLHTHAQNQQQLRSAKEHQNPAGQSQQHPVNKTSHTHSHNQQQFRSADDHQNLRSVQEPQNVAGLNSTYIQGPEQAQQHPANKTSHYHAQNQQYHAKNYTHSQFREQQQHRVHNSAHSSYNKERISEFNTTLEPQNPEHNLTHGNYQAQVQPPPYSATHLSAPDNDPAFRFILVQPNVSSNLQGNLLESPCNSQVKSPVYPDQPPTQYRNIENNFVRPHQHPTYNSTLSMGQAQPDPPNLRGPTAYPSQPAPQYQTPVIRSSHPAYNSTHAMSQAQNPAFLEQQSAHRVKPLQQSPTQTQFPNPNIHPHLLQNPNTTFRTYLGPQHPSHNFSIPGYPLTPPADDPMGSFPQTTQVPFISNFGQSHVPAEYQHTKPPFIQNPNLENI